MTVRGLGRCVVLPAEYMCRRRVGCVLTGVGRRSLPRYNEESRSRICYTYTDHMTNTVRAIWGTTESRTSPNILRLQRASSYRSQQYMWRHQIQIVKRSGVEDTKHTGLLLDYDMSRCGGCRRLCDMCQVCGSDIACNSYASTYDE
jgi:hypothetical protein